VDRRSLGGGTAPVPVVGLGTWARLEAAAADGGAQALIDGALDAGITVFDSSPMYGQAEELLSGALAERRHEAFVATKIWTPSPAEGRRQLDQAVAWFGPIELMQIHNLVAWRDHLTMLERARDEGQVELVGATHYQEGALDELEVCRHVVEETRTGPDRFEIVGCVCAKSSGCLDFAHTAQPG
jgi:diketogulonate reductase-like aldo/keto reductase